MGTGPYHLGTTRLLSSSVISVIGLAYLFLSEVIFMTKSFENRIFLSQTEVAERLGASPGTVKKLRDTGILPYTRFPASTRIFILVKDVEEMETQFLNPGKGVIKTPNRLETKRKKPEISSNPQKEWRIRL